MCARAARATSNAASPRGTAPSFMTAAHATLPIPSYVQVTNLRNGRRVVVKVNDRGPFHENRLIDLSYVAALKLGIVAEGTGHNEVRALKGDQASVAQATASTAPVRRASPDIYLQAGAFADRASAERLTQRIAVALLRCLLVVCVENRERRVLISERLGL